MMELGCSAFDSADQPTDDLTRMISAEICEMERRLKSEIKAELLQRIRTFVEENA